MLAPHFANFILRHHEPASKIAYQATAMLVEAIDAGSSCLNLAAAQSFPLSEWTQALAPGAAGSAVGNPGDHSPLILSAQGKLYLQRYYIQELAVFRFIDRTSQATPDSIDATTMERLRELFGEVDGNDQALAALTALKRKFCVITGGPGTGKTTTVVKTLELLRQHGCFSHPDDCLLLAPTGKAADRLKKSIQSGISSLNLDASELPCSASTIHRALGYIPGKIEFRHNRRHPLNKKLIVVDETSMVDLPLMSRLLDAIPDDARLILLGDKNQLASVSVGTVLADLIEAAETSLHPIKDCVVTLRKSYRTQGSIDSCCKALRVGDAEAAWEHIQTSIEKSAGSVTQQSIPSNLRSALSHFVETHWLPILSNDSLSAEEKLAGIDHFRILSPMHRGRFGVANLNATVKQILATHGVDTHGEWYSGRSIIVQKNAHELEIFNGDTGLVLREVDGDAVVHFPGVDGTRKIRASRLPEVLDAWALTIHRTQGSEYDHILLIIPPSTDSELLSRELLYTGLSRAKASATLWCEELDFHAVVGKTVQRASGLLDKFLHAPSPA